MKIIWRSYSWIYSEHNCSCISTKPVWWYPYLNLRRIILMTYCRT